MGNRFDLNQHWPENPVPGLARNTDPETSHLAAALVDAPKICQAVYLAMEPFGNDGCISDQVGDALAEKGIEVQTFTPRFRQMVDLGMIEVLPEKRRGHHNNRLQQVRRILPPPWSPPMKLKQQKCCPHCGRVI